MIEGLPFTDIVFFKLSYMALSASIIKVPVFIFTFFVKITWLILLFISIESELI